MSWREKEDEITDQYDDEQSGHLLPVEAHEAHEYASGEREGVAEVQRGVVWVEQVP